MLRVFLSLIFLLPGLLPAMQACAQQPFIIQDNGNDLAGRYAAWLADENGSLQISDVVNHKGFKQNSNDVLNLGLSRSAFWIKLPLKNNSNTAQIWVNVDKADLDSVEMYVSEADGSYRSLGSEGIAFPFRMRKLKARVFAHEIDVPKGVSKTLYIKVRAATPLILPIRIAPENTMLDILQHQNAILGIYAGVILCMVLYNLFLMFSIREDRSYIWYVLHTIFVGLAQLSIAGYAAQYLWPGNVWLAQQSIVLFTCLVSVAGIIFLQVFLNTKVTAPKAHRLFYVFFVAYVAILITSLSGQRLAAFRVLQPVQGIVALFILIVAIRLARRYRAARFYVISWSMLLLAIIVFALRDSGIFPFNDLTENAMLYGSGLQVILLSFALGDKINTLQAASLAASLENERLVTQQNVILESKVRERTLALNDKNEKLNSTLEELIAAQTQLVESEKMASLGQLTAGIAHEINNPINFVISNESPLRRDVGMLFDLYRDLEALVTADLSPEEKMARIAALKEEYEFDYLREEVDFLLNGIREGATRTAEIVKGLRIFSRVDEDDIKRANIHEGLDSTAIIINTLLNNKIRIEKNYSTIPQIECYPGKLNQVFLNIITNGIHAIQKRFGDEQGGVLTIATSMADAQHIEIRLGDNGTGMTEETCRKIFEPFFTTKDVGEGTGLGLSIAYNVINKHNGHIRVGSILGEGTTFTIILPVMQQPSQKTIAELPENSTI